MLKDYPLKGFAKNQGWKKSLKNIWKVKNKVFIFAASKTVNEQRKRWDPKPGFKFEKLTNQS